MSEAHDHNRDEHSGEQHLSSTGGDHVAGEPGFAFQRRQLAPVEDAPLLHSLVHKQVRQSLLVLARDQGMSRTERPLTPGDTRSKAGNVQEGSGSGAVFLSWLDLGCSTWRWVMGMTD